MAKQSLLTAAFVGNTKQPKLHADGDGLFLRVSKTGAKSWIFRFRRHGKRSEMDRVDYPSAPWLKHGKKLPTGARTLGKVSTRAQQVLRHITSRNLPSQYFNIVPNSSFEGCLRNGVAQSISNNGIPLWRFLSIPSLALCRWTRLVSMRRWRALSRFGWTKTGR